ncbi:uncharacterized protein LOC122049455 [Zingiber officinale]|uniref:uncharacterized protein LOC122049455 n=1 Tax=Zingiber officinale TaxID=94328 RepID=UPI001C4AC1EC|nr:uncharacterized protein LOC122049455 [Zingiber officinale]
MRIRRRASSSLHPSPDPSYSSQNEHLGAKDSIAAQGGKLHQVVIGVRDPPKCPTHPDEASFSCPNPCSDAPVHRYWDSSSGGKAQWRLKKEEEDGNQRGRWQADCSKNIISGSSAMANNGNREEREGKVEEEEEEDQRKAKEKTKSSSCCTSAAGEENDTDSKRPRRRPAVVMEGSRCSRVNGRGWRCGQQTLVGYSLCEHHLGKGRLRNMSISSRGQVGSSKHRWRSTGSDASSNSSTAGEIKPDNSIAGGRTRAAKMEQEQAEMTCNRRKKTGTVRARSISSLLDDYDHHPTLSQAHQVASLPPLNASGNDNE